MVVERIYWALWKLAILSALLFLVWSKLWLEASKCTVNFKMYKKQTKISYRCCRQIFLPNRGTRYRICDKVIVRSEALDKKILPACIVVGPMTDRFSDSLSLRTLFDKVLCLNYCVLKLFRTEDWKGTDRESMDEV